MTGGHRKAPRQPKPAGRSGRCGSTPSDPSANILSTKHVLTQVRDQLARYAGQPPQRRGEGGLLAQHLDDASTAVDPDPVAAVQAHGGVAASDHGRDAELAGHDRGMGQWRADVGDDGRGAGEDQRPADVGDRGDQDLAIWVSPRSVDRSP